MIFDQIKYLWHHGSQEKDLHIPMLSSLWSTPKSKEKGAQEAGPIYDLNDRRWQHKTFQWGKTEIDDLKVSKAYVLLSIHFGLLICSSS